MDYSDKEERWNIRTYMNLYEHNPNVTGFSKYVFVIPIDLYSSMLSQCRVISGRMPMVGMLSSRGITPGIKERQYRLEQLK